MTGAEAGGQVLLDENDVENVCLMEICCFWINIPFNKVIFVLKDVTMQYENVI